jgi:hypothetical protein
VLQAFQGLVSQNAIPLASQAVQKFCQSTSTEDLLIGIADAAIVAQCRSVAVLPSDYPQRQRPPVATPTKPQRVTLPMPLPVQERYLEVAGSG